MSRKFSFESIEYLTEKLNNSQCLSHESLIYLTVEISELIFNLLQDSCKVLRKCHRNILTTDDFAFALKLYSIEPLYGGYSISNIHQKLFRKIKKDNRILYQIEDNIVPLKDLMTNQMKIPLDISIRTHWLAVDGKQMIINENPIIEKPIRTISQKKFNNKKTHILSLEQQIYCKELTEICICSDEQKRKQALLILSSDNSLQQIISRLILFISEGICINLTAISISNRTNSLYYLIQMIEALLKNKELFLEPYLHDLLPSILSCLLDHRITQDHWLLRDLSSKCCGQILRSYSTAANRLQQRTIDIFYRILNRNENDYTWPTQYGAFIGLCEMSHQVIIQIVFPLVKQIGEKICTISDSEISQKFTEIVVKYIITAYRSVENDNEKKLDEEFGSYFAPLIHQQLILLL